MWESILLLGVFVACGISHTMATRREVHRLQDEIKDLRGFQERVRAKGEALDMIIQDHYAIVRAIEKDYNIVKGQARMFVQAHDTFRTCVDQRLTKLEQCTGCPQGCRRKK